MRSVTFVVGTGRSGSTALSRILRLHPDILSLNELLASVGEPERALPRGPVDGGEFWRILAEPNRVFEAMIRSGTPLPEFLYTRRPGRYAPGEGVPALCLMVLPHLTDDPDGLLDELAREVAPWPRRPAAEQYEALFDVMCARFGARAVVERSGYSLHWVPHLLRAFPHARFVHLHREGPDCALSMSRHPGYRAILLLRDILARSGVGSVAELTERHVAALPPDLAGLLADRFDPALIWDSALPVAEFGALWSELIVEGLDHLAAVPEQRCLSLAYEDLLDQPERELGRIARFAGAEPLPRWLTAGRGLIDTGRRGSARHLPPGELAALEAACAPGTAALRGRA